MYTDKMKMAFHSIPKPKNFSVEIVDNEYFLTVRADENDFIRLHHDDKIEAVKYMITVKRALEENGAVVLLMRRPVND